MKPDIRLIALDMDGTLLASDHTTIPRRNLEALREAASRGISIAIASGRSWSLVRETAQELGVVTYGITGNGAYVLETATGAEMVKFPMDAKQCVEIIKILEKWEISYELYIDGQNYVQEDQLAGAKKFALSDSFLEVFQRNMALAPDMKELAGATLPEKFDCFYVPPEKREELAAEIRKTGPVLITGALPTNMELTAENVHKGRALAALSAKLGLKPDQVMAFGDADNDLEMLSWAGWSFAMENGTKEAKKAAKRPTLSNDAGGVGAAVEKYILG